MIFLRCYVVLLICWFIQEWEMVIAGEYFIKSTYIGIVCYALIEISANRADLWQESHTKLR